MSGEGGERTDPGAGKFRLDRTLLAALVVVLGVQVVLMVGAFMPAPHTGGDNAGYLGLAFSLLERGAYLDLYLPGEPLHVKYPPAFPALLAGAALLGVTTWVGFKAVVALTATAAVLFVFLWMRERRGSVFAAVVALLVAASSAVIYYSHWVLSDVPFLALTFLSLWGLERWAREDGDVVPERGKTDSEGGEVAPEGGTGWLVLGGLAAVAAYFTRSAGLPLVLAVAGVLVLRRRWRPLAVFGAGFGVPALAWALRARAAPGGYVAEFLLVDPYQPDLGRIDAAGLATRVVRNAAGYASEHIPGGITGMEGTVALILGLGLTGLAARGWWTRVRGGRARIGAPELFLPLYAGIVLLWPEVWSGDRFALPLIPLFLFYGGAAAADLARGVHRRGALAVGVAGVLLVGGPAVASWTERAGAASECMTVSRSRSAWACTGPGMSEFVSAAGWSAANLPEGSVVISRKPRFFYLMSGIKSEMFPLSRDPGRFFSEAERLGASYVLLDRLDGLAGYYLVPVVQARPNAFCPVTGFGSAQQPGAQLLGVLRNRAGSEATHGDGAADGLRLASCPEGMTRERPRPAPDYSSSSTVPLFRTES